MLNFPKKKFSNFVKNKIVFKGVIMNVEIKNKILKIIRDNPRCWHKILNNKKNLNLLLELKKYFPQHYSLKEMGICLLNDLTEKPKCKICGKEINTIKHRKFAKYCSSKCAQNDKDLRNKIKQTCLEKYGVDNPAKCEEIQQKMKNTCLEKYGSTNIFSSEIGKNKIKESLLDKYNVENPAFLIDVINKRKQTLIEKYDVTCGFLVNKNYKTSKGEDELYLFIKQLKENSIHSDREQIFPLELDIYIPDLKIAIEYDGDYWHSLPDMKRRDNLKNKICKEKGINLFRVKESDWYNNKENIKENFRRILNG